MPQGGACSFAHPMLVLDRWFEAHVWVGARKTSRVILAGSLVCFSPLLKGPILFCSLFLVSIEKTFSPQGQVNSCACLAWPVCK